MLMKNFAGPEQADLTHAIQYISQSMSDIKHFTNKKQVYRTKQSMKILSDKIM